MKTCCLLLRTMWLGGGFIFLLSLFGEMIQFDWYFFRWVETTNLVIMFGSHMPDVDHAGTTAGKGKASTERSGAVTNCQPLLHSNFSDFMESQNDRNSALISSTYKCKNIHVSLRPIVWVMITGKWLQLECSCRCCGDSGGEHAADEGSDESFWKWSIIGAP